MSARLLPLALAGALSLGFPAWLHAGPLEEALAAFPAPRPGYGICLFDAQGPLWSHCEGLADERSGVPFSEDTVLRLGATSELFTVVLALQRAGTGDLDPEQPISRYVPEPFSGAAEGSALARLGRMPVRTLMGHLTGTDATFFLGYRDYDPFTNLQDYLREVNLKHPPEAVYLRSGAMIDLLGLALAKIGGQPFEDLARTGLFEPLGMGATSFRYRPSPRDASLRYKSAAPDSYATRIPGFREAVAPSGSALSTLRDLATFHSALLRNGLPHLSRPSCEAMFTVRSEAAARRQGLRTGYVWKLSLADLAYLGRVAWYSGKFLSHRNVVILLPDRSLGVVCATNAWSIFEGETIQPMAIAVLKAYAKETLRIPEPVAPGPARTALPPGLGKRVAGLYAAGSGVYRVALRRDSIQVASEAVEGVLFHTGRLRFQGPPEAFLQRATFAAPDTLSLALRSGAVIEARRVDPQAGRQAWLKRRGTYRIVAPGEGALYAFTLGVVEGEPVVSGDDGIAHLLVPREGDRAGILCDESSRFFGMELRAADPDVLILDGRVYHRGP